MVRLKDCPLREQCKRFILFQFHYGTIKSDVRTFRIQSVHLFQFHYGTIKSDHGDGTYSYLSDDFNSTMVRLKGSAHKLQMTNCTISIPLWYD